MSRPMPVEIDLDAGAKRLYDRMRRRIAEPARGGPSGLGDWMLLLPDLTALMFRLLRDPRVAPGDKLLALLGVGYVVSPLDLLPTFLFGPMGLLDDLLVVSATLSRLVNHVHPDVVRSHWSGQGDALEVVQRLAGWAEDQFSGRLRGVLRRLLR